MFKTVEPYEAPLELNKAWEGKIYGSELFPEQQKFLCGLIRDKRPKKILELGVAAGGTSCLIQYTLQLLGQQAEMYSIDVLPMFYRDDRKEAGFLLKEMAGKFPLVQHHLFVNGTFPEFAEQIGNGIDFLVLDTAHALPGELLEFLVCLPYLTEDATVVLHDVMQNQGNGYNELYASKVLYMSVTADKYICWSHEEPEKSRGLANIGAFTLNERTRSEIENCFYALSFNWCYMMEPDQEERYRGILAMHYPANCLRLYDTNKRLNRMSMIYDRLRQNYHDGTEFEQVLRKWRLAEGKVLIYGCGEMGRLFYEYGQLRGFKMDAFVVSDVEYLHGIENCELPMWQLREVPWTAEDCTFIITPAVPEVRQSIERNLRFEGYTMMI